MSRLKKTLLILIGIFLILNALPYLVPVTKAQILTEMPFPDSRIETVEGIRLHYRIVEPADSGDAAKTKGAILFVHGLGGSTFSWRNNTDIFAEQGYFVVAVDLPGFGFSDRSRGILHSQEHRAQLLWALLDQVGAEYSLILQNVKWNLAGHSMGVGTVTAMAAQRPEQTACLIFADAAVLTGNGKKNILFDYPPVQRWTEVIARHYFFKEARIEKLLQSAYGRALTTEESEGYFRPFTVPGTEGAYIDIIRTSTQTAIETLQSLEVPVLAVWGEMDTWVPVDDGYKLEDIIRNYQLTVIPGAGHCAMETHADIFNAAILEGLDGIAGE